MAKPFIKFGVSAKDGLLVGDTSDAHLMTIAPTGAGKGRTSIIPNLLTWPGSVFVIDPKGENVAKTAARRLEMGQKVFVLDPFEITKAFAAPQAARFNPFDYIGRGPAGITQADRLADTLIIKEGKENRHFSDEARALLKALILHVRTYPAYGDVRNLQTVNALASDPDRLLDSDTGEMRNNPGYSGLIQRLAKRMAAKEDREGSSVWSTVQANLGQFLDDPRVADNLSHSSFDFADLRAGNVSVYAVLPAQYLETFSRWLRLLVGAALDRLLEGMSESTRPDPPVLFVLDEFAHLGNLEAVKTAYGLARGAGVKIWMILQSLSQLDDIYDEHGRENFIANSGTIEIFNMTDNFGCQYFSERIGEEYVRVQSANASRNVETRGPSSAGRTNGEITSLSEGTNWTEEKRARMLPRDIAALDSEKKILFRRNHDYEIIRRVQYDQDPKLRQLAGLPTLASA